VRAEDRGQVAGEYGSLDGVIANADKIGGKIGENLRAALPRLPLNRELTTIKTDVRCRRPAELAARARRRGLARAVHALRLQPGAEGTRRRRCRVHAPREKAPGIERGERPSRRAADRKRDSIRRCPRPANTNACGAPRCTGWACCRPPGPSPSTPKPTSAGPDARQPGRLSFASSPARPAYMPVAHDYPGTPAQLPRDRCSPRCAAARGSGAAKLGQHGKYDLHVLRRHGIDGRLRRRHDARELRLNSAGSPPRHGLAGAAYLGYATVKYEDVAGKGAKQIGFSQVALDDATRYAAEDADITLRLHRALLPKLQAEPALRQVYRDIEMPLVPVLARIERNGVLVDAAELRGRAPSWAARCWPLQQKAHRTGRRSLQPGFAQAARRAAVRRARPAGAGEDPERPAVHQRGRAGGTRRPARAAAQDPRVPRRWRSCAAPIPTSCRR
jgi:DNA polymerase-1